jgi:hypothetical protein
VVTAQQGAIRLSGLGNAVLPPWRAGAIVAPLHLRCNGYAAREVDRSKSGTYRK